MNQWVRPNDFPGANDVIKIQAALDSGKPNIYFPRYYFVAKAAVITVPATVNHLDFMRQVSWLWGGLRIDQALSDQRHFTNITVHGSNEAIRTGVVIENKPAFEFFLAGRCDPRKTRSSDATMPDDDVLSFFWQRKLEFLYGLR